ncbi:uncharacterized protein HKW66_Vig0136000 [Vigna angularis]|uniref:Uncharacterized protein n=1 Tax=Phaseolus angularis TaxID=3914 RepID=A0A8T0KEW5_PHAAN|nr:uncharacterized protein HKW66_Vig0136000 [Vigna angularis]
MMVVGLSTFECSSCKDCASILKEEVGSSRWWWISPPRSAAATKETPSPALQIGHSTKRGKGEAWECTISSS